MPKDSKGKWQHHRKHPKKGAKKIVNAKGNATKRADAGSKDAYAPPNAVAWQCVIITPSKSIQPPTKRNFNLTIYLTS